jgi:beta-N-acetylhexosaminidase
MQLTSQKLGKHFIVGLESSNILDSEKLALEYLQPTGIILFSRNFENNPNWKSKTKDLILDAKKYSKNSIKLVSIDFEGGRVNRFPEEIKRFPYAQSWGEEVHKIASEMAEILNDLGINLTYGPVADVDLNEKNPVIGKRAFSNLKEIAAKACLDFLDANKLKKIICCGKHFPGHGRTSMDSHFELPEVNCVREELETDLFTFKELINANIPLIMTAHVNFICLDQNYPASLSKKIQTDLLRDELGFKGLIISDDLDMKALGHYTELEKVTLAINAGTDFLLFGNGMDGKALETSVKIVEEILSKDSNEELIVSLESSSKRIDNFLKTI